MTDIDTTERERMARAIADAQNVPFVGSKQLRIADALIAQAIGDVSAERKRADKAEVDTRRKIAQEVHDWAALHAGPEGSYAARIIENRIREKLPKDGTEDQPAATPEPVRKDAEQLEAQNAQLTADNARLLFRRRDNHAAALEIVAAAQLWSSDPQDADEYEIHQWLLAYAALVDRNQPRTSKLHVLEEKEPGYMERITRIMRPTLTEEVSR